MSDFTESEFQARISSFETFLSSNVGYILIGLSCEDCFVDSSLISDRGLIKWEKITEVLEEKIHCDENLNFKAIIPKLHPLFKSIETFFSSLISWEVFEAKYSELYKWISQAKMIEKSFKLLTDSSEEISSLHALLILVSLLERGLGDIILLECEKCPMLLKDLLLLPQLSELLSPTVVNFLRVLIGPPTSLNLRNLAWHGFLSPKELSLRYPTTIICTILSIGDMLIKKNILCKISHRVLIEMPDDTFKEDILLPAEKIEIYMLRAGRLLPTMEKLWCSVMSFFHQSRYGECVVILLPMFEHLMRCIFALVNNTFGAVLTAEMMILDCLVYQGGPRIRDRISHGEVNVVKISRNLTHSLLTLCTFVLMKLFQDDTCLQVMCGYKSQFHPISLLSQKLINFSTHLRRVEQCFLDKGLVAQDLLSEKWNNYEKCCGWMTMRMNSTIHQLEIPHCFQDVRNTVLWVDSLKIHTLYRYEVMDFKRREKEIINVLDCILSPFNCSLICLHSSVEEKEQKKHNKELRSRQRATYAHLLNVIPSILCTARMVLVMASSFLKWIERTDHNQANEGTKEAIRFFKKVKKFVDNLESALNNNRWLDLQKAADDILKTSLPLTKINCF